MVIIGEPFFWRDIPAIMKYKRSGIICISGNTNIINHCKEITYKNVEF